MLFRQYLLLQHQLVHLGATRPPHHQRGNGNHQAQGGVVERDRNALRQLSRLALPWRLRGKDVDHAHHGAEQTDEGRATGDGAENPQVFFQLLGFFEHRLGGEIVGDLEPLAGFAVDPGAGQRQARTIETLQAPREGELRKLENQIKALQGQLEKDGLTMSESDRRTRENELGRQTREFQRLQREFREDLNLRRNEELAALEARVRAYGVESIAA